MLKTRLRTLILIVALAVTTFGLDGCRKQDNTPPSTPPAAQQQAPTKQLLPTTGQGKSPLPTPGTNVSPVKR
jgi:hypothetical protein